MPVDYSDQRSCDLVRYVRSKPHDTLAIVSRGRRHVAGIIRPTDQAFPFVCLGACLRIEGAFARDGGSHRAGNGRESIRLGPTHANPGRRVRYAERPGSAPHTDMSIHSSRQKRGERISAVQPERIGNTAFFESMSAPATPSRAQKPRGRRDASRFSPVPGASAPGLFQGAA